MLEMYASAALVPLPPLFLEPVYPLTNTGSNGSSGATPAIAVPTGRAMASPPGPTTAVAIGLLAATPPSPGDVKNILVVVNTYVNFILRYLEIRITT